jgi:hypothetical protein
MIAISVIAQNSFEGGGLVYFKKISVRGSMSLLSN